MGTKKTNKIKKFKKNFYIKKMKKLKAEGLLGSTGTFGSESDISVVLSKDHAVLRPGCQHSVRLCDALVRRMEEVVSRVW